MEPSSGPNLWSDSLPVTSCLSLLGRNWPSDLRHTGSWCLDWGDPGRGLDIWRVWCDIYRNPSRSRLWPCKTTDLNDFSLGDLSVFIRSLYPAFPLLFVTRLPEYQKSDFIFPTNQRKDEKKFHSTPWRPVGTEQVKFRPWPQVERSREPVIKGLEFNKKEELFL